MLTSVFQSTLGLFDPTTIPFLNYMLNKVAPVFVFAVVLVVIVVDDDDDVVVVAAAAQSILQMMTSDMLYHRCFCINLLYRNTFDTFSAFLSLLDLFKNSLSLSFKFIYSLFFTTTFTSTGNAPFKISLNFISFQELQGY